MEIVSRKKAKSHNLRRYFTGKPCCHGHTSERLVSSGQCVDCSVDRVKRDKIKLRAYDKKWKALNRDKVLASERKTRETRKVAHEGETRYFTGKPCINGHIAERFVSDKSCMLCRLETTKRWARKNKDKKREYDSKYIKSNRKARTEYSNKWAKNNPDKASIHRRNSYALRKSKKARGKLKTTTIDMLMKAQNKKCPYCRTSISKHYHLDHILALANGGVHELKNWQLLCPKCNSAKGKKDAIAFAQENGLLL